MMEAMDLRSPAPIQSRLKYLVAKGWIHYDQYNGICLSEPTKGMMVHINGENIKRLLKSKPNSSDISEWANAVLRMALND